MITQEAVELIIILMLRLVGFFATAPFFNGRYINTYIKGALSFIIAICLYFANPGIVVPVSMFENTLAFGGICIIEVIIGASLGFNRSFLQGLFNAPGVVNSALKGAVLAAKVFEKLGFKTSPSSDAKRNDIVEQIYLENAENVIKFCQEIQHSSPIDSHVTAEP